MGDVDLSELQNILFSSRRNRLNHKVPVEKLYDLLALAGQNVSDLHFEKLCRDVRVNQGHIDWEEFLRLEANYRVMLTETLKDNQGFIESQVEGYQKFFREKDPRDSGMISVEDMSKYIKKTIPQVTWAIQDYRKLHEEADFKLFGKV